MDEGLAAVGIVAFTVFVLVTALPIARRGAVFVAIYGLLYVYTIATQIAYVWFPWLVADLGTYYGEWAFGGYFAFVFLSFVAVAAGILLLPARRPASGAAPALPGGAWPWRENVFRLAVLAYVGVLAVLLLLYVDEISYAAAGLPSRVMGVVFAQCPTLVLLLYVKAVYRSHDWRARLWAALLLAPVVVCFLVFAVRSGNRVQLVGLALGLGVYCLLAWPRGAVRLNLPHYAGVGAAVALMVLALAIGRARNSSLDVGAAEVLDAVAVGTSGQAPGVESFLAQDYLAPSLMLMVSVADEVVIPGEVLASNLANLLPGSGYPLLAEIIGSRVSDEVTRTRGFAYYLLGEGYNMLGMWGVLYNALIVVGGCWLWSRFTVTRDPGLNRFMAAVICMHGFDVVRAQSVYFIRDAYLIFLPAVVLYLLAFGWPARAPGPAAAGERPEARAGGAA